MNKLPRPERILGLDESHLVQYCGFWANIAQGGFRPFLRVPPAGHDPILERLPATLENRPFLAMGLALLVAIPLGVYAGANPASLRAGRSWRGLSSHFLARFWLGMC